MYAIIERSGIASLLIPRYMIIHYTVCIQIYILAHHKYILMLQKYNEWADIVENVE